MPAAVAAESGEKRNELVKLSQLETAEPSEHDQEDAHGHASLGSARAEAADRKRRAECKQAEGAERGSIVHLVRDAVACGRSAR